MDYIQTFDSKILLSQEFEWQAGHFCMGANPPLTLNTNQPAFLIHPNKQLNNYRNPAFRWWSTLVSMQPRLGELFKMVLVKRMPTVTCLSSG